MIGAHAAEVEMVLQRLCRWANVHDDVRALVLVGSWAQDAAHAESDVDVVLLTVSPGQYIDDDKWIAEIGDWRLLRTQQWGAVTERRLAVASGLTVELNVASLSWASTDPLDAGTRRVISTERASCSTATVSSLRCSRHAACAERGLRDGRNFAARNHVVGAQLHLE